MTKKGFNPSELMRAYGWEQGRGLGRSEDGMKEPIKARLKFDTAGVGHDQAEQFTFHWWDHAYNSAAKSIQVSTNEDSVAVEKVGDCNITTKKDRALAVSKKRQLLYGNFVKSAILDNGVEEAEEKSDVESDVTDENEPIKAFGGLTDAELFDACGGRTAHKGARHGLRMSGKHARLAKQEMTDSAQNSSSETPSNEHESSDDTCPAKSKKKKTKKSKISKQERIENQEELSPGKGSSKSKKKHKKNKRHDAPPRDTTEQLDSTSTRKKRKRKRTTDDRSETELIDLNSNVTEDAKGDSCADGHTNACKKKRKKDSEKKSEQEDVQDSVSIEMHSNSKKNKKKKKKSDNK